MNFTRANVSIGFLLFVAGAVIACAAPAPPYREQGQGEGSGGNGGNGGGGGERGGGSGGAGSMPADAGHPFGDGGGGGSTSDGGNPEFTPAPHPAFAQIANAGGGVLTQPKLVAVTFAGDPLADQLEPFIAQLGASKWWRAVASEYGIGPAIARSPVRLQEQAPASTTDPDIQTWLKGKLDGGDPAFPPPEDGSFYVLFYPSGTTFTHGTLSSCGNPGISGFHSELALASGAKVVYAPIARCTSFNGLTGIDEVTGTASHEIIEGSTDPFILSAPAYLQPGNDDIAWSAMFGFNAEVGDLCTIDSYSYFMDGELGRVVQRSWSNAAARAGKNPCVPAQRPMFAAATSVSEPLTLTFNDGTTATTKGIKIASGQSRTIDVTLFSDAPTGEWKVSAIDDGGYFRNQPQLGFAWDKTTGKNGDVLKLTITVLQQDSSNIEPFFIVSTMGTENYVWAATVGQQ